MPVHQLLCSLFGGFIILADEVDPAENMAIQPHHIGAVLVHFGDESPGGVSHSLRCTFHKSRTWVRLPSGPASEGATPRSPSVYRRSRSALSGRLLRRVLAS